MIVEEAQYFKENSQAMTKEYDRIKVQFEHLAQKLAVQPLVQNSERSR